MARTLLDVAQARWRAFTPAQPVPLVRAGVVSRDGVHVERSPHPTWGTAKAVA